MIHSFKKIFLVLSCCTFLSLNGLGLHAEAPKGPQPVQKESPALKQAIKLAEGVKKKLSNCKDIVSKRDVLLDDSKIHKKLASNPILAQFLANSTPQEAYVLALATALNQYDDLFDGMDQLSDPKTALKDLVATLVQIDSFYAQMNGLLGYHETILNLLANPAVGSSQEQFLPPPSQDMRKNDASLWDACYEGTKGIARTACIFPIGGAGDRLNLIDEVTKEPLPASAFVFCGKSLLEWLMRDVEAASYWYWKTFGTQINQPIVLMTSLEKNNDAIVGSLGDSAGWYGLKKDHIFRMVQPLVIVVDSNGKWVTTGPLKLALKPGGHGVIWKLAETSGAFKWLDSFKTDIALIRQINNPIAGLDTTTSSLVGYGIAQNKSFGFASCPPRTGFAEGMNILSVRPNGAAISNIEYTHFKTLQTTMPKLFDNNSCPANTNLLFAHIPSIQKALVTDPFPGLLINPKTTIEVVKNRVTEKVTGARLESMMQNIADAMRSPINLKATPDEQKKSLQTFLNLYDRLKLISVTKKAFQDNQNPYETPESCLYDWNQAMRKLLSESCAFQLPPEQSIDQFLKNGPEFSFFFNPALGPFWAVISQKLNQGTIAQGSEVNLDIAELFCQDIDINGSFQIIAKNALGPQDTDGSRLFSDKAGRAYIKNCRVINKGMKHPSVEAILKNKQERLESCDIILEGFSELVASDITFKGNFHLVVPDGKRATLFQSESSGKIGVQFENIDTPSWRYSVRWNPHTAPKLTLEGNVK